MRFKDAHGRKVVSTANAETVGKVDQFVVDPVARSVVALEVKKADEGDTLPWASILGFGADAVTVADGGAIVAAPEELATLLGKDHRMLGKRVLSAAGDELGKLEDVAFDPESGAVTGLVVAGEELAGSRLVGVGSYAVVVATA